MHPVMSPVFTLQLNTCEVGQDTLAVQPDCDVCASVVHSSKGKCFAGDACLSQEMVEVLRHTCSGCGCCWLWGQLWACLSGLCTGVLLSAGWCRRLQHEDYVREALAMCLYDRHSCVDSMRDGRVCAVQWAPQMIEV